MDGEIHDEQRQPDQQVVDDEMREVGLPAGTEHGLLAVQGEHFLDQDEDHAGAQQVEDEPVEPDIRRVVGEVADRHAMAARRRRQQTSASAVPFSQRLRRRIRLAIAMPPAITMPTSRISRRMLTSYFFRSSGVVGTREIGTPAPTVRPARPWSARLRR